MIFRNVGENLYNCLFKNKSMKGIKQLIMNDVTNDGLVWKTFNNLINEWNIGFGLDNRSILKYKNIILLLDWCAWSRTNILSKIEHTLSSSFIKYLWKTTYQFKELTKRKFIKVRIKNLSFWTHNKLYLHDKKNSLLRIQPGTKCSLCP